MFQETKERIRRVKTWFTTPLGLLKNTIRQRVRLMVKARAAGMAKTLMANRLKIAAADFASFYRLLAIC
jgi:hypothetical protein